MFRGFTTAMRTLTILPIPGGDAERPASALPWFPLVGAVLGLILYGIAEGLAAFVAAWPAVIAPTILIVGAILTGGLHWDGLADWADGFFGARTKEKTLAIMKDPRVGSFGVLAVVSVFTLQFTALARLAEQKALLWVVAAGIVSRTAQVIPAVLLPYARVEGGTAAPFVSDARRAYLPTAGLAALALLWAVCGAWGAVLFAGIFPFTLAFAWWCRKRVGGVTGDLLGAGSVLTETVVLLFCAAAASHAWFAPTLLRPL
jgi:adenosylcobinamide-GDP ribazoletransferase